jgi:hypothetical protein
MSRDTLMGVDRRSPSLVLETPGEEGAFYVHNELRVSGRAVDAERVTVELTPVDADGNSRGPGVKVEEPLGDLEEGPGRRFDLQLQTAECSRGVHSLKVSVTQRDADAMEALRTITIEPYDEAVDPSATAIENGATVIRCEVPVSGRTDELGRVFIRGWCYATCGIDRVVAFLDGRFYHEVLFPVPRRDVEQALGRPDALLSGFALPLNAEVCPPGDHSLTLLVTGTDRHRAGRSLTFRCGAVAPERDEPERTRQAGNPLPPSRVPKSVVEPSMDRSELCDLCEFENLRATIAERHAFVSLTESNVVTAAYAALQQKLDNAQRALCEAERRAGRAEQRAAAAEYWLEDQRRSLSWRVTEPLRAAKQAARRIRR